MTTRGSESGLDDEQLVALYGCAKTVRLTDERAGTLADGGAIGFQAPTGGHEAAVLCAAAALREQDWHFAAARDHAAALWRGLPLRRYWDHLFANADDVVKGRPMPDHFSYRQARVASVTAPLGSQLSHAVGLAWAARSRGADEVALVMFGDDDVSSSDFHNALNFAGVWRAPVVFFCRNDAASGAGAHPPPNTPVDSVAERGIAYGVQGQRCDGGDVEAVHSAV
ncbi:MAG: thiamine pyrophosphate-dependent enzyme, partial [Polyangiaceae bacterium]